VIRNPRGRRSGNSEAGLGSRRIANSAQRKSFIKDGYRLILIVSTEFVCDKRKTMI
jgi:hypothetical protein